jgi:cytochrome c oxidase subunit IV
MSDHAPPHNAAHYAPDQHAGGPPSEPLAEHGHHGHDNSPEAIRKEMRKYLYVFGALALLTAITVGISYLHLPTWQAVVLALIVATVKGSLVAAFFMHLLSERKLIYAVLVVTVFFFGVLMWGPWHHRNNAQDVWPQNKVNPSTPSSPATDTGAKGHAGH